MAGAPQILPPVGSLGDYVSLSGSSGGDVTQILAVTNPWLTVIMFALDILELAGIIPDPFALLFSLFSGRPREQASILQAQRLASARNPAARQAGIMLERMVKEWDIVTSEGGSGRAILDAWSHLFTQNLVNQGVTLDRARQILVNATSRAAQEGLALEPELTVPLAQGLTFNAPPDVAADFTAQYQKAIAAGKSIDDALKAAEQWLWRTEGLSKLFKVWIGQWIPLNPPPDQLVPSQGGNCPAGYTLDPKSEMCVLNTTIPPPGGGGGGGGGTSQPDPEGDEITNDLCGQMAANTAALIDAINSLPTSGGAPADPACCDNIVNAIGNVATALGSIASAVASAAGGAPVDLSGVVDGLNRLVAAVGNLTPTGTVDITPIADALNRIANDLEKGTGTDVSGIVDQLKAIVGQGDVDQAIFQALQQAGLISPADVQTLQGIKWSDALSYIMSSAPVRAVENFIKGVGADADTVRAYLGGKGGDAADWIFREFGSSINTTANALQTPIAAVLEAASAVLKPAGAPAVGDIHVNPDRVVADVAAVALNMQVLTTVVSLLREGAGEELAKLSDIVTGILGFEELKEVQLGPLVRFGIARIAEMQAKALFQQELPGRGEVAQWTARGLLDPARADELYALNGLHFSLRGPAQQAAYRGLQPFILIRLLDTGLFSAGDLTDEMTFSGIRPASQKRIQLAAPWLATASERKQLESSLEKAYINGLLSDADLQSQVAQLDQDTDRNALILARVQLEQRIAFAKELEKSYSQAFTIGALTEAQYRGFLEGIGLQASWINTKVAADQVHMTATAYRKELAAELALERATASEERRAAVKNFTTGNIDAAALLAALLLTGLNATQAAAWVDLAQLQKAGGLRWIFGMQLPAPAATLLRSRVTALSDQRKRLQITDPELVASLQALGIPPHYVNVIRATADAMISPKTSAVTIPVETS